MQPSDLRLLGAAQTGDKYTVAVGVVWPNADCAVGELHALRTSGTQLSRDDNLATLSTTLHDESEDTIACSADGKTVEELVSEGLALGDSGETTVLDLSGVEGDGVLWELESLLDEGGKFADSSTLLSENFLGVCCADDDYKGISIPESM